MASQSVSSSGTSKALKPFVVEVNPKPPKPDREKVYTFTPDEAQAWIYKQYTDYQDPLAEMIEQVRCISFPAFAGELRTCVDHLPSSLNNRCAILVSKHKSNQWVAELAGEFCNFKGTYMSLGHDDAGDYVQTLATLPPKHWPKDVVIFDDAS